MISAPTPMPTVREWRASWNAMHRERRSLMLQAIETLASKKGKVADRARFVLSELDCLVQWVTEHGEELQHMRRRPKLDETSGADEFERLKEIKSAL